MGIQLAPIEGTPYAGGTATGVIYLDANGLQRTDGPTVDASGNATFGGQVAVTTGTATDIPVTINLAAAQSANALNVTSNGGTAGDLLKVSSAGAITIGGKTTINGAGSEIFSAYDLGGFSIFNFGGGTYTNHMTRISLHAGYTKFEHAAGASALQVKTAGGLEVWNTGTVEFFAYDGSTPGAISTGQLTVSAPTVPASASATGTAGTVSWDSDYIYICTATDTWKRVAIATW